MSNYFSIKRVLLLIQRFFLENFSREIFFWLILTFVFTVLDQRDFVRWVMYISGYIFAIRSFKELNSTPVGVYYFNIPTTLAEKLAANILLCTVYFFGMTLLAYSMGNMLVTLVYHNILKINIPVNWDLFKVSATFFDNGFPEVIQINVFWQILSTFITIQSVGMLGSLYFKSNPGTKTIISVIGLGFVLIATQFILFKTLWNVKELSNALFSSIFMFAQSKIPPLFQHALTIGGFLVVPYLWVVSYFRLKEREI